MEDYDEVVGEIQSMEKNPSPHSDFEGEIHIRPSLFLSPADKEINYEDMLNDYGRLKKIRVAAARFETPEKIMTPSSREIEQRIQEVSKEASTLKVKESQTEIEPPKPIEVPEVKEKKSIKDLKIIFERTKPAKIKEPEEEIKFEEQDEEKIKFEKPKEPEEIKFEKPKIVEKPKELITTQYSDISFEYDAEPKIKTEKPKPELDLTPFEPEPEKKAEIPYMLNPPEITIPEPQFLKSTPRDYAEQKYEELKSQITVKTTKKTIDKTEIKSKMLELTKQLFREKSVSERQKLKTEIVSLKNMLNIPAGQKGGSTRKFYDLISNIQESEMKDILIDMESVFLTHLNSSKDHFYSVLGNLDEEDTENRQRAYEVFSGILDDMLKQFSYILLQSSKFLIQTHTFMLQKFLEEKVPVAQKTKANKQIKSISSTYPVSFMDVKSLFGDYMLGIKEKASFNSGIASGRHLEQLVEIMNLTEEQLLNYLNSNYQKLYQSYQDKEITKIEALSRARMLLAKEKGLSNELMNKYFSFLLR